MKTHILSLLLFLTFSANCQTTNKEPGQECYKAGKVVLDKLIKKETTRLNQHFPENTLKKLVELIAKKEEKKTDIYFDYRNGRYIFTIFSGRHIDNGTDWGLYEYLFITTITFDYVNNAAKIISTNTIFEDKSEKKNGGKVLWTAIMTKDLREKNGQTSMDLFHHHLLLQRQLLGLKNKIYCYRNLETLLPTAVCRKRGCSASVDTFFV